MPTKKQLSRMREAEFEYPQIRRKDDPGYKKPEITKTITPMESKEITPEQLLAPRYEVIADYPNQLWNIGTVLIKDHRSVFVNSSFPLKLEPSPEKYPAIFKPLQWWEQRKVNEMPNYVRTISKGEIVKVTGWEFNVFWTCVAVDSDHSWMQDEIIPASEEEYNSYINSKK